MKKWILKGILTAGFPLILTTSLYSGGEGFRNLYSGGYGEDSFVVTYTSNKNALPVMINIWAPVEARRSCPPPEMDRIAGEPMGGPLDDPNLTEEDRIPWGPAEDESHRDEVIKGKWQDFSYPFKRKTGTGTEPNPNSYYHKVRYVGIEPYPLMKLNAGDSFKVITPAEYEETINEYKEVVRGKLLNPAEITLTPKDAQEFNSEYCWIYKNTGAGSEKIPYIIQVRKGTQKDKFLAFKNLSYQWKFTTQSTKADGVTRTEKGSESAAFAVYDPFEAKQIIHTHTNPFDPGVTLDELEQIAGSGEIETISSKIEKTGNDGDKDTTSVLASKTQGGAQINEFRQPISYLLTYDQAEVTGAIESEPNLSGDKFLEIGSFKVESEPKEEDWTKKTHNNAGLIDNEGNPVTGKGMIYVEDYEVPLLESTTFLVGDMGKEGAAPQDKSGGAQYPTGLSGQSIQQAIELKAIDAGTVANTTAHFKYAIGTGDRYWTKVYEKYTGLVVEQEFTDKDNKTYWKLAYTYISGHKKEGKHYGPYAGPVDPADGITRKSGSNLSIGQERIEKNISNLVALIRKADILWDPVLNNYCVGPLDVKDIATVDANGKVTIPPGVVILPKHYDKGNPNWKLSPNSPQEGSYGEGELSEEEKSKLSETAGKYENRYPGVIEQNTANQDLPFVVLVQDCCNNAVSARGQIHVTDATPPNLSVGVTRTGGDLVEGEPEEYGVANGVNDDNRTPVEGYEFDEGGWRNSEKTWDDENKYPGLKVAPVKEDERIIFTIGGMDNNRQAVQFLEYKISGENLPDKTGKVHFKKEETPEIRIDHVFPKIGNYKMVVKTADIAGNERAMTLNIPVVDQSMDIKKIMQEKK